MRKSWSRFDKINEEVKRTLSTIIPELKDPRVCPMTSVVRVEVTNDYKQAKVFVSVYDKDDAVRKATVKALNYAEGFIAHEVGMRMDLRRIPTFKFILDESIEYSVHISKLISDLNITPKEEDDDDKTDI